MDSENLSKEELIRYSRQILLPEMGEDGQKKLKEARVLIVGAGGLGSPAAIYLAAAGVGRIGIVDHDRVELVNLQRQILHATPDVGRMKTGSAVEKMAALNPLIKIDRHNLKLTSRNALQIVEQYDMVIDGTDNFPTRYLLNDACALLGKPYIYGSIYRFEGQVTVFDARTGPCYRCLFPEPPPPHLVPSCDVGGVIGVLPGIIGSLQAMEAIKLILGIGEPLTGKLLLFDALKMSFNKLKIRKVPQCVLCGENPTITGLIDYDEFCSGTAGSLFDDFDITPGELKQQIERGEDILLIDVRTEPEYRINRIEGSRLVPLFLVPLKVNEWRKEQTMVVYCKTGVRSAQTVNLLRKEGFTNVRNLVGGIDAWIEKVDPSLTKY